MTVAASLSGVRVLDMTHVLAGPYCAYQLALLGADVVKIEAPDDPDAARGRGGDPELAARGLGVNYQTQGGGKRALALNLKAPNGRAVLKALAARADVLVENYRPGAMAGLGLGPDALRAENPRLIYCSISGFGQDGERPRAYDNTIQAASGIMARTGGAGAPVKTGASMVDYATGMAAAFAVVTALYERERTGLGRHIDCAMFDVAMTFLAPEAAGALHEGPASPPVREAGLGCYPTREGDLMLGAFNPRQNRRLWSWLGDEAFAAIEDWPGLWAAAPAMRERLRTVLRERTAAEWEEALSEIGVPAARVATLDEAVRAQPWRRFFRPLPAEPGLAPVHAPGLPFRFDDAPERTPRAAPRVGEHTDAVLRDYGFDDEAVARLHEEGTVS